MATKGKPPIFSTTDCFGNFVVLYQATWDSHVLDPMKHPEMAGYEGLVRDVLEDPEEVRLSAQYGTGAVFISPTGVGPSPEGIRVVVAYRDAFFEKGASFGSVATTYPIDLVKYSTPKIGKSIYKKGK